jgi:hypothetical protein
MQTLLSLFRASPNAEAVHLEGQPHDPLPDVLARALL